MSQKERLRKMTIERLPSGSYRIRQTVDKKRYSVTVDHKPTQSEALKLLASVMENQPCLNIKGTVMQCVEGYLENKCNVLSPSTYKGYTSLKKAIDPNFAKTKMSDLTLPILQQEVNRFAVDHSPKYTLNYSSFLTSVARFVGLTIQSPTTPQQVPYEPYIPSKEDIKRIADSFMGSEYEVAFLLTMRGLRRSELMALTVDDVIKTDTGYILRINKAKVEGVNGTWHEKTTKTMKSTRTIDISEDLAEKIINQGYIYRRSVGYLRDLLAKKQDQLGIPHFPLHVMRHFYASYLLSQGFDRKYLQGDGGWKNSSVMEKRYLHALEMQKAQHLISDALSQITE